MSRLSKEVQTILAQADGVARASGRPTASVHVLVAFCFVDCQARDLLAEAGVDDKRVLDTFEAMSERDEPPDALRAIHQQADTLTTSANSPEMTATILLASVLRVREALAWRVLEAAGYTVHVAHRPDRHLCCGRTYLATGMVDQAREQVRALVDYLLPLAQQGVPIVGLEPSCLLTLRDEALQLGLGEAAHTVASQALLWEEFLDREHQAGRLDTLCERLSPAQAPFLLHGHCHQKAFDLVSPIQRVLGLIPHATTTLIETSCCGKIGRAHV